MKLCQRCVDAIRELVSFELKEEYQEYESDKVPRDVSPEAECEFVTHRALREMARWFALESGGDHEDLRRLTAEIYEVVDGKREQYMKGTEP